MSKEFKACGIVPMLETIDDKEGESRLTLETMLAFENEFMPEYFEPWYQKAAKQAQNEDGKLVVRLRNGAKIVFADFRLPNDMLCIPSSSFDLLPSQVLMFLAKDLPTEDTEINFVGGTIVKKKVKEK